MDTHQKKLLEMKFPVLSNILGKRMLFGTTVQLLPGMALTVREALKQYIAAQAVITILPPVMLWRSTIRPRGVRGKGRSSDSMAWWVDKPPGDIG